MATCQNMGDYLLVESREPYSLNQTIATIHEIADHCRKDNLDKVLFDLQNWEGNPNILERYQIGLEIAKTWGPRLKVAVIARSGVVSRMMENTAVNRGAKLLVTSDVEAALE